MATEVDKAKGNVLSFLFSSPLIFNLSAVVFLESKSLAWKTIWLISLMFIAYPFIDGIRVLKAKHE